MTRLTTAITLLSLIMLPFSAQADTIILKSGRQLNATKCWDSGDQIKCKIYGQVIGYQKSDIAEAHMDTVPTSPIEGFRYDIWQSGISVREAIDIAEANDLPFHRGGLISANKRFNPKMCRPYADSATEFYYKDQILGKWATLSFKFTPSSKRLYSLTVAFSGPGISRKSEFREQVESMLVTGASWNRHTPVTNPIKQNRFDFMTIGKSTFKSQGGSKLGCRKGSFFG